MKTWTRLLALALLTLLVACKKADPPEQVLSTFLDHLLAGERAAAWELLSGEDRAAMTAEAFAATRVDGDPAAIEEFDAKTSYVVQGVSHGADRAVVTVAITTPDAKAILGGIFGAAVNTAVGDTPGGSEQDRAFIESLQAGEPPRTTFERDYHLRYQEDRWWVYLDLAGVSDEAASD